MPSSRTSSAGWVTSPTCCATSKPSELSRTSQNPDLFGRDSGPIVAAVSDLFEFPDPVNEVSARLVAGGVVAMCVAILAGQTWLIAVLAYGFVARVLTGPTLSP